MIKLSVPLSEVKNIGPRMLERLKKLNLLTVKNLLWHFPFRYEDFSKISKIKDVEIGQTAVVQAVIKDIKTIRTWKKRMIVTEALISDNTSSVGAVWFNQPYLARTLKKGTLANFAGKVAVKKNKFYFSSPTYEIIARDYNEDMSPRNSASVPRSSAALKHTARIVPVYPETKGLTSRGIRFLIKPILDNLEKLPEILPRDILSRQKFLEINSAIRYIHFPRNFNQVEIAKKRFAFEDLFLLQLNNLKQRLKMAKEKAYVFQIDLDYLKEIISRLPFELTLSQKKSLWEILQDLQKAHPMNRFLQGDVGSGKTIVAGLAALMVTNNSQPFDATQGKQTAFMAPTEVLAKQHYLTLKSFFHDFDKGIGLITSGEVKIFYGKDLEETEIKKKDFLKKVADGEIKIIIGTHSLIQKNVNFDNLALVVIDEQHRFGIRQRAALATRINTDKTQTDTETGLLYANLTYKIRGIIFKIRKEMGLGHKENIYQKIIEKELERESVPFKKEKVVNIQYGDEKVGVYRPDFIIDDKIIVEIKALPSIGRFEKEQLWHYLKGTNYRLGLLINFGRKDIQIERIIHGYGGVGVEPYKPVLSPRKSVFVPHFLSMSATPIPRTLSLTIFGDLDLSMITELPKGRKEIITKIVSPANREKAYQFIRDQIKKGRQAFVICPRIDPAEIQTDAAGNIINPYKSPWLWEVKAVKEEYEKLSKKTFPDLKVGMLHGKLKAKEKSETMKQFSNRAIDVLVSTSVVEVGVDVPNATIMMIEGSERFGLAQLYQFRGRVGRGEHQSFCFLLTDSSSKTTRARLHSLIDAKNGFELAEKDLAIRGPGQILGAEQTGMPDLAMKAIQNPELIKATREAAAEIIKADPELINHPVLKARLESFEREVHLE